MPRIDPTAIRPTLPEVGKRIMSRTLDSYGNQLGTFTDETEPTATQAAGHIEDSSRSIALKLGNAVTTWRGNLDASAKDVVAIHAALVIATSGYGAGTDSDAEQAKSLGAQYREELDALIATAKDNQPGGTRYYSVPQRNWTV